MRGVLFITFLIFSSSYVSCQPSKYQALQNLNIDVSAGEQVPYAKPMSFNMSACPPVPLPPPTDNVNKLHPGHIKVVMAMGDSITAAMSAKDTSIFNMKDLRYRGLAYSIGADAGVTTMPNILKTYSPQGYPIGSSTGIGARDRATNGLNAAVSGAINKDMPSQAQWLVAQLKANKAIDYNNDWKLLTLWIGSNNLCDVCGNEASNNADDFEAQVTQALEYLYANVPRVFVNLLVNLDITQLDDVSSGSCTFLHSIACSCVVSDRAKVFEANVEYQLRAYTIAQKFASRQNPSFTVVVQPFLEQTSIDLRSELSAADCFHPSALSHSVASVALWNNMVSPAAQKKRSWSFSDSPLCATANTLLCTN